MFAVFKTGGKQYKVVRDDILIVEKLSANKGDTVQFDEILVVGDKKVEVGLPKVDGAAVHAEVVEQKKTKKVISFVKRRRKHSSQRTKGHRQNVTVLRIKDILLSGASNKGVSIESGSSIIASSSAADVKGKSSKKDMVKIEGSTKGLKKSEAATKPVQSADAVKKASTKSEVQKKTPTKGTNAKKSPTKTDNLKKLETKASGTKDDGKSGVVKKATSTKKSATKKK